jgi:hypothetical protein
MAFDNYYRSHWEDVWIKYFTGKGNIENEGPCILSRIELEGEIKKCKELRSEFVDYNDDDYIAELEQAMERFNSGANFAVVDLVNEGIPNIFVNEDYICRKTVEKTIEWYLRSKGILKSRPRFKWSKPSILIYSANCC